MAHPNKKNPNNPVWEAAKQAELAASKEHVATAKKLDDAHQARRDWKPTQAKGMKPPKKGQK